MLWWLVILPDKWDGLVNSVIGLNSMNLDLLFVPKVIKNMPWRMERLTRLIIVIEK